MKTKAKPTFIRTHRGDLRLACVHCHARVRYKPCGLCRACFDTPRVRRKYILLKEPAPKDITNSLHRLPAEPTSSLPGTPERIAVMAERLARGEDPVHPEDAKLSLD